MKVTVSRLSSHHEKCQRFSPELQNFQNRNSKVSCLHYVLKINHEVTALEL